jgi:hypothetical protein
LAKEKGQLNLPENNGNEEMEDREEWAIILNEAMVKL